MLGWPFCSAPIWKMPKKNFFTLCFECSLFHQVVWEHAQKNFGKLMRKSEKFGGLVRRCLALPFLLLTELQDVIDDFGTCEMDSEAAKEAATEFLKYIQATWIDGPYSPEMWSCFGRRSDFTNNAQEAYNAVLNRFFDNVLFWILLKKTIPWPANSISLHRLVAVAHPNLHSLIQVIVEELNAAEITVTRVATGQLGRRPPMPIFQILHERTERLQKLYAAGFIPIAHPHIMRSIIVYLFPLKLFMT